MLQTEANNKDAAEPIESESKQSKPERRGGKRPGAGRKPNPTKLLRGVSKEGLMPW